MIIPSVYATLFDIGIGQERENHIPRITEVREICFTQL